jgi:hypothetical protein
MPGEVGGIAPSVDEFSRTECQRYEGRVTRGVVWESILSGACHLHGLQVASKQHFLTHMGSVLPCQSAPQRLSDSPGLSSCIRPSVCRQCGSPHHASPASGLRLASISYLLPVSKTKICHLMCMLAYSAPQLALVRSPCRSILPASVHTLAGKACAPLRCSSRKA